MIIAPGDRIASLHLPEHRHSRESSSRPGGLLTILLVLPAAVLLLTPFGLLAYAAAVQPDMLPDMLIVLAEKPLVALQLALGLMTSVIICALPFRRFGHNGSPAGELTTASAPLPDTESDRQPLAA